jgi:fatty acid desaturase
MKKYMDDYVKKIDQYISNNKHKDIEDIIRIHLRKIKFFQHERLVHLIVTLFFALFAIIFSFCININNLFILITFIFYIILIFYIFHYYYLENTIEYMYKQHDKLIKIANHLD